MTSGYMICCSFSSRSGSSLTSCSEMPSCTSAPSISRLSSLERFRLWAVRWSSWLASVSPVLLRWSSITSWNCSSSREKAPAMDSRRITAAKTTRIMDTQ